MEQARALTILLIETDHSLRRLISLGLQHRGMHVVEVSSPDTIPSLDADQIDLLVLDVDGTFYNDRPLLNTIEADLNLSSVPTVVLSWDNQPATNHALSPIANATLTYAACLEKPFDARILHKTIDCLLAAKGQARAAAEAEQEARLLASYNSKTAPSIWPVITAAGLLIAVAGLLFQLVIAVVGLVVVVVALLLWTLGSSRREVNPHIALS
jgi:DNA-binding response OmpR family regulator